MLDIGKSVLKESIMKWSRLARFHYKKANCVKWIAKLVVILK